MAGSSPASARTGTHLIKRFGAGTGRADADELWQYGAVELCLADDADIEEIASAMITLTAALQHVLKTVADDEAIPPDLRRLATAVLPAAELVWAHYGGDSGGW